MSCDGTGSAQGGPKSVSSGVLKRLCESKGLINYTTHASDTARVPKSGILWHIHAQLRRSSRLHTTPARCRDRAIQDMQSTNGCGQKTPSQTTLQPSSRISCGHDLCDRQYATMIIVLALLVELLHPFFRAAAPRQRKRGSGAASVPRGSTTSSSTSWLAIALECVCRGAAPATMRSHNVGGADARKDPACADRNQPLTARERDIHAEQEWPALEARLDDRARALCALEQGVLAQQGRPHKFMMWQRGSDRI